MDAWHDVDLDILRRDTDQRAKGLRKLRRNVVGILDKRVLVADCRERPLVVVVAVAKNMQSGLVPPGPLVEMLDHVLQLVWVCDTLGASIFGVKF